MANKFAISLMFLVGCGGSAPMASLVAQPAAPVQTPAPALDPAPTPAPPAPTVLGQWVMGYYVGYQINSYPIAQIDWTALTHIIMAPLTVRDDLTLDFSFLDENGTGEADARALAQAAHAHGKKALLMLGGAQAGATIAMAALPARRDAFVAALIDAVNTLGYDGIDLDWEDSVDLDNLTALAQALRAAQPALVLSYPAFAVNGNYQTVDPRYAVLAQSLDRFNVQTYYPDTADVGDGWSSWFGGPLSGASATTPVTIEDTLARYAAAGVPKQKLGMGASFYAICYDSGITAPRQPTTATTHIGGGDNDYPLSQFYAADGTFAHATLAEQLRDDVAAVPYLSLAHPVQDTHCGAGVTAYLSYEDETSLRAKGTFSKQNGYGGIIVWTIQQGWLQKNAAGDRAQNSLMQALKSGFLD